jgi:hypothetical protein
MTFSRGGWLLLLSTLTACGGAGGPGGTEPGAKSADDAPQGEEAAPKLATPPAGSKQLEKRTASLDFELTLRVGDTAGGMQAGNWSLEEERSQEVLQSKGAVNELKVVYGRREAKPLLGVELTTATAGHTYVIKSEGGEPTISREDGEDPSGDERDALMSEYSWVGGMPPLSKWLRGGALPAGKTVEGGSEEARALVGVLSGVDYAGAKVTAASKGKQGDDLSLDVTAKLRLTSGETFFDLDLKGPASVDTRTGWVKSLELSGPVKASGKVKHKKKGMLDVTGKGTARIERHALE